MCCIMFLQRFEPRAKSFKNFHSSSSSSSSFFFSSILFLNKNSNCIGLRLHPGLQHKALIIYYASLFSAYGQRLFPKGKVFGVVEEDHSNLIGSDRPSVLNVLAAAR